MDNRKNQATRKARTTDGKEAHYGLSAEVYNTAFSVQEKMRESLINFQKDKGWPWVRILQELRPIVTSKSQLSKITRGKKDISIELYVAIYLKFGIDLLQNVEEIDCQRVLSLRVTSLLKEICREIGCSNGNTCCPECRLRNKKGEI